MCGRRSSREHDSQLTFELDPGNQRFLTPSPVIGRYILHARPTVGAILKDAALREQCVVETTWMVYVTKLSQGLYINL